MSTLVESTVSTMAEKFTAHVTQMAELAKSAKKEDKAKVAEFFAELVKIASTESPLTQFGKVTGILEISGNQEEIEKNQKSRQTAIDALKAAGFPENSEPCKAAVKGFDTAIAKLSKETKTNLPQIAEFLKVKTGKTSTAGESVQSGQLAMYKPTLADMKTWDFLFKQNDRQAVIVHSMTISENALTDLGIKPESTKWVVLEYNGNLQATRMKSDAENGKQIGDITTKPENWLKAYEMTFTGDKLSPFTSLVAVTLGLQYHGNGWQSLTKLNKQFDGIARVIKA